MIKHFAVIINAGINLPFQIAQCNQLFCMGLDQRNADAVFCHLTDKVLHLLNGIQQPGQFGEFRRGQHAADFRPTQSRSYIGQTAERSMAS